MLDELAGPGDDGDLAAANLQHAAAACFSKDKKLAKRYARRNLHVTTSGRFRLWMIPCSDESIDAMLALGRWWPSKAFWHRHRQMNAKNVLPP